MAPVDSDSSSDDLEPKVPGPPKTNIADSVDHHEKVIDAESNSSTSSEYMGPSYGHSVWDAWEENFGIFARAKEEGVLDHVLDYYGLQHEDVAQKRGKKEINKLSRSSSRVRKLSIQGQRQEVRERSKSKATQLDHPQPAKENSSAKKERSSDNSGREYKGNEDQSKGESKDKQDPDDPGYAQNFHVAAVRVGPILKGNAPGGITEMTTPAQVDDQISDTAKRGVDYHGGPSQTFVTAKDVPPSVDEFVIEHRQVKSHDPSAMAPSQRETPLFEYSTGYYLSAVLVAAAAASLGIIAFVLPAFKKRQRAKDKNDAATKNSRRRLHVRDWQPGH